MKSPPSSPGRGGSHPGAIERLLERLHSARIRVRHASGKKLRALAESRPDLLAPHFDRFVRMLDHPNRLFRWEAIVILSHLAGSVPERRLEGILDRYFSPITGPEMITAANVIAGGARIAAARPQWADRISRAILKVAGATYRTGECRRIAIGHAITALDPLLPLVRRKRPVIQFVQEQLTCARPATRAKAERFLKRHLRKRMSVIARPRIDRRNASGGGGSKD